MARPANGKVPSELLVEVEPGMFLEAKTAAAYLQAKQDSGGILRIPGPAGAYRSFAVQDGMKKGVPSFAHWNLDPGSSVSLASAGHSSHGYGDRLDVVTGTARTWAINNLTRYGFTREFGSNDPGHFQYLHPTWEPAVKNLPADQVKLISRYLNSLKLGKSTTANIDGEPGTVYWTLVQTWGSKNGHYPQPAYKIDGKPGAKTYAIERGPLLSAAKDWDTPPVSQVPAPPVAVPEPPVTVVEPPVTVVEPPITVPELPVVEEPVIVVPPIEEIPPVEIPVEEEPAMLDKPSLFDPDPEQFDEAVEALATQAKWLPLSARKKVYNTVLAIGGVAIAIAGVAAAVAPAVGGEIGGVIGIFAGVATTVGTLAGTASAALSRNNLGDPIVGVVR